MLIKTTIFSVIFLTYFHPSQSANIVHYGKGERVDVYVNKVGPYANPHETYHYYSLPICRPDRIIHKSLSLGQVLEGDRMAESHYLFKFADDQEMGSLCGERTLSLLDTQRLVAAIEEEYFFEIIIDDLRIRNFLGFVEESKQVFPHVHRVFVYTEYPFIVEYNGDTIISINLTMNAQSAKEVDFERELTIDFRYAIKWISVDKPVDKRPSDGQLLFSARSMQVHWLSVINALLLVILLIIGVTLILFSAVRRDLMNYNEIEDTDILMENGWKTVFLDVFRKPKYPMLLSAVLGVGTQFLTIGLAIQIVATTNLINIHHHGNLNTLLIFLYASTSFIAGYVSAAKYKQLDGKWWITNVNLTSGLFGVPMMVVWMLNNSVAWANESTQALPWTTVVIVLIIALAFGYPLAIAGALAGRHISSKFSPPCRTRTVPRQIPAAPVYLHGIVTAFFGGLLPFSSIFLELYYIFSTIWGRETYTLFHMLSISFGVVVAVVACLSIALTYFQLNVEDYRWWWRSIFNGGSSALFIFAYGVYFLRHQSSMSGAVQLTEFFTHLSLLCYIAFLSLGTVSYFAAERFVFYIFSHVKTD
ncbi:unnamed protein product, partial [Mesorhabditis spiculigera]